MSTHTSYTAPEQRAYDHDGLVTAMHGYLPDTYRRTRADDWFVRFNRNDERVLVSVDDGLVRVVEQTPNGLIVAESTFSGVTPARLERLLAFIASC